LARRHLKRITLPPVKPLERFEAAEPNDFWQINIMGKTHLKIGRVFFLDAFIISLDSLAHLPPFLPM
jgi:hypothetical protein